MCRLWTSHHGNGTLVAVACHRVLSGDTYIHALTISLRQAGVAAHRAMTLEDDRPLDRHASGDRNIKF